VKGLRFLVGDDVLGLDALQSNGDPFAAKNIFIETKWSSKIEILPK